MNKRWLNILALLFLFSMSVQASDRFVVNDIRLEGLERIPDGTLLNYLPIHVGDPVDASQVTYAIRQLYKTGFFRNVILARDGDVLVVQVVERPAIAEVTFTGNNDIEDEQLEEILIQGMPLGAMRNASYDIFEKNVKSGDTILLLTDGLPEQMNNSEEMFEYRR